MATVTLTWHSLHDTHTCKFCEKVLDQHSWTFQTNEIPDYLEVEGRVVWNKSIGSRAHGEQSETCRCWLTAEFDFSDWIEKLENLHERLLQSEALKEPAT